MKGFTAVEPMGEARNIILLTRNLVQGSRVWDSFPFKVEISDNNLCNLCCIMCSPKGRPPVQRLTSAQFHRIASQVFPYATILIPSADSEPFLANLPLILEACEEYDLYLDVYTNATLLSLERLREIRKRLYKLQISFDSHRKEVYEKVRSGARFEKVLSNIRETLAFSRGEGIHPVAVAVLMTENMDHLHGYMKFVREMGFHFARIQRLLHIAPGAEMLDPFLCFSSERIEEALARIREAAREFQVNLTLDMGEGPPEEEIFNEISPVISKPFVLNEFYNVLTETFPWFCPHVAYYMKITPDGRVYPCCRSQDAVLMGNILENDFMDIWNGEQYQVLRAEFFEDRLRDCCRACSVPKSSGKKKVQ